MPYKDLHEKPFDETTITKLEIFQDYAQAWIPTFLMRPDVNEMHVFDFFSGPGYDCEGIEGSPIRILKMIKSFMGTFFQTRTKIVLHLNEFEPQKKTQEKYQLLKKNVEEFKSLNPRINHFSEIHIYNKDAGDLFFELLPLIKKHPSLVYLDQNGVKFISAKFLRELEQIRTVDFIYFVSSSYFLWLGETPEFKKVLDIDLQEVKKGRHADIHRTILDYLKKQLPSSTELMLFPFSLKKGANLYGIIFGSKHPRAVDKFLAIAWKRNETNGEANFDIDEEKKPLQLEFFSKRNKISKVQRFKNDIEIEILAGNLQSNKDVLLYAYSKGHIPDHAVDVIKDLKKKKLIRYNSKTPCINYNQVFKLKNRVTFEIINN